MPPVNTYHHHVPSRKSIVQASSAPKKIAKIQFGTMSTDEIQRVAQVQVSSRVLFQMPDRRAAPHGCMDPRLGISDKMSHCRTCLKKLTDCSGHFGFIQLELPVFHAGYFKHTLTLMQCICKKCSRVLVSPQLRQQLLKRIGTGNVDALARAALFKKVEQKYHFSTSELHRRPHNSHPSFPPLLRPTHRSLSSANARPSARTATTPTASSRRSPTPSSKSSMKSTAPRTRASRCACRPLIDPSLPLSIPLSISSDRRAGPRASISPPAPLPLSIPLSIPSDRRANPRTSISPRRRRMRRCLPSRCNTSRRTILN